MIGGIVGNSTLGYGLHIPPPVISWSRWDTLATIGLLLAVWLIYNYIVELPD
jgi:hypothetical protein